MSIRMRSVSHLVFILLIFLLAGCASGPVVTATSPSGPVATAPVLTPTNALPGYPAAETQPASPSSTVEAYPGPGSASTPAGAGVVVTRENNGQTINLHTGDRFVLQLGEEFTWNVTVADQSVVSRVINITPIRGSQGVYEALAAGTTSLAATGDPLCRSAKPACAMPSLIVEVQIVVQ